jgi:hypothetical protein
VGLWRGSIHVQAYVSRGDDVSAIYAVLARLPDARSTGRDRWRCACPVCGERNRSTLSIGVGDNGAVLLKCWKSGCDVEQIANTLGLDIGDLFPGRDASAPPLKRRGMLSAQQALEILRSEALFVAAAGSNVAQGVILSGDDIARCWRAAGRIAALCDEVRA